MQTIIPHLWFDKEAKEAAEFYIETFGEDSRIISLSQIHDTPSGTVDMLSFELWGQEFAAISAGPLFRFNPSISLQITCRNPEDARDLWIKLSRGSKTLMEFGEYPFSRAFGWLEDKYGLCWQINTVEPNEDAHRIIPCLFFVGNMHGKAKNAMDFYLKTFAKSQKGKIEKFDEKQPHEVTGNIKQATFKINDYALKLMESALDHEFEFNEAISFIVKCQDQKEIDYYWNKLSAKPDEEQCGWLKDRFGISWQVLPMHMEHMIQEGTTEQVARLTEAFLSMKKFDLEALAQAYRKNV